MAMRGNCSFDILVKILNLFPLGTINLKYFGGTPLVVLLSDRAKRLLMTTLENKTKKENNSDWQRHW